MFLKLKTRPLLSYKESPPKVADGFTWSTLQIRIGNDIASQNNKDTISIFSTSCETMYSGCSSKMLAEENLRKMGPKSNIFQKLVTLLKTEW